MHIVSFYTEDSAWVIVDGGVYDVTDFLEDVRGVVMWLTSKDPLTPCACLSQHPGGKKILLKNCGKDASEAFWTYHSEKVLQKTAAEYKIGEGEYVDRVMNPLHC